MEVREFVLNSSHFRPQLFSEKTRFTVMLYNTNAQWITLFFGYTLFNTVLKVQGLKTQKILKGTTNCAYDFEKDD